MESCIYDGWVRHRRYKPVANEFQYRLFMMYLDLAELPSVFAGSRTWSNETRGLAVFRRTDHVGDPEISLDETIRELVRTHCGERPRGPIRLLTNLRYFGHCFNPVSFYYCFDESGTTVRYVVAEVTNTPWQERHCYVMDPSTDLGRDQVHRYRYDKGFHVSPFMTMDIAYDWRFREPDDRLIVHNDSEQGGEKFFDTTLSLERRELNPASLRGMLFRYPFMTLRVVFLIHWQALRLFFKRVPFVTHPRKSQLHKTSQT
ncbi:MAG: DUF1365 domain-containing protein [Gammaproteobacteria bacterium]|nr:DUF1365 domain-containing protein [Gammaproteobacteria bacterium]